MAQKVVRLTVLMVVLLAVSSAWAQTIDFELLPDGSVPKEGLVISNQFESAFGVSFKFEDGSYPRIAKLGYPGIAFYGPPNSSKADTPATNQNIGTFFLTDDGTIGIPPSPLLITYANPVYSPSGVLIDIDDNTGGPEAWTIEALGATNQVLDSLTLTPESLNAGDGLAAAWAFLNPTNEIYAIRIKYVGQRQDNVGLAFDNFTPANLQPATQPGLSINFYDGIPYPGLTITGAVAAVYRIEHTSSPESTNWTSLNTFLLPTSPYTIFDDTVTNDSPRYYRAVGF